MSSFFDTFVLNRRQQLAIVVVLLVLLIAALAKYHFAAPAERLIPSEVEGPR